MLKIIVPAALLAAAFPALAHAAAPAEDRLPDIRVVTHDLDLTSPAGIRLLDRRIAAAIKAACPDDNGVRDLALLHDIALCRVEKRAEVEPLRQTALAAAAAKSQSRLAAAQ